MPIMPRIATTILLLTALAFPGMLLVAEGSPGGVQTSLVMSQVTKPVQPIVGGQPTAPVTAYLTAKDIEALRRLTGQIVLVRGEVDEYKPAWNDRAPNIVYLRDGDKTLEIVFWTGPATDDKPVDVSKKGTPVYARGKIEVYRGRLQVNLDDDLWNLSTEPLPADVVSGARDLRENGTEAPQPAKSLIRWEPYSPLSVHEDLQQGVPVIIYARSRSVPMCSAVEKAYLLHPDLATFTGPRTIHFLDLSQEADMALAQQLQIIRVPALIVLKPGGGETRFVFTKETTGAEVAAFLKSIPR